jgi:halimadienyl-diphosphate synthase
VVKILNFLMKQRIAGGYWTDKWHLSPYYATSHIIITCNGYAPEIAADAVQWILKTQNTNGSWGVQMPTAEETAYCIQALWSWMQQHTGGEQYKAAIRNAITWLLDHADPPYHPLWIGKCLYCPENVIRSAILSALSCEV